MFISMSNIIDIYMIKKNYSQLKLAIVKINIRYRYYLIKPNKSFKASAIVGCVKI